MKLLLAMFQGGGNVPLIAPIAEELVRRGHHVRLLAGPGVRRNRIPLGEAFLERMQRIGCELAPFELPTTHPFDADYAPGRATRKWVPAAFAREALNAHTTVWSPCWAANVETEIHRQRPDAVIADFMLLGALAAAEARGVPSIALVHNVPPPLAGGAMPPESQGFLPATTEAEERRYRKWNALIGRVWVREGLMPHNHALRALGLEPLSHPRAQFENCARVLVLASESFDFPGDIPRNTRYVGTPIDDLHSAGTWSSPWPADDPRPLLLISLSTLAQGQKAVLQRCVEAAATLPIRVLVTLGPALERNDFATPPNTVFEPFVPHSAVLPHVSAVVSQCGLGTLMKTLKHGLPVVCLPLAGDQPDNAARVAARGAGIRLNRTASVAEIREAIERVLVEPSFREQAHRLAQLMTEDAPQIAANEIEAAATPQSPA